MTDTGAPAWLRASVLLGVPSIIALFLVWAITTQIAARITSIEHQLELHNQSIHIIKTTIDAQNESFHKLEQVVRSSCVISAHSPEERAQCLQ